MQIHFAISARLAAATLGCLPLAACSDPPRPDRCSKRRNRPDRDVASLPGGRTRITSTTWMAAPR